ncbi:MAG: uroporphyrinogen decarboxylase family protein, partial [bacterium]|nr:uroporphyrinogen decarboxylase family protein [bacterium]
NPDKKITFQDYTNSPDVMFETQLQFQYWSRHNLIQDAELGLPSDSWKIFADFQNFYEATWFGAEVHYYDDQVPDTLPFLNEDNKRFLFDRGLPNPFTGGLMKKVTEYWEYFNEKVGAGSPRPYLFHGIKVENLPPSGSLGTDGILTVATNLRGAGLYLDFYDDPEYVKQLLDFVTTAVIERIRAWRNRLGQPERTPGFGFADDSIQLISTELYEEFVLPCHKRLIDELSEGKGPNSCHLCGDVMRHLPIMKEKLNVTIFDTGFPLDFGWVRKTLGPEVEISGGPRIDLLLKETPEAVEQETKRILQSGIMDGGRFILREGNNLAPYTPLENIAAMYSACKKYGRYSTT